MNFIQTDLRRPVLAASIQDNLHAFLRQIGEISPIEGQPVAGIVRWQTAIAHPWFNGVLAERPPGLQDEQLVKDTIAFFQSRRVPRWNWWVGGQSRPKDWAGLLGNAGLHFEKGTPGMALDLQMLNRGSRVVPGLEIQPVKDLAALRLWCQVFVVGYGLPPDWSEPFYELMAKIGLDLPTRNYIGYLNGEPVAASSLFLGAGVAGIYSVATLPQARRKGIGAAMTVAPLLEARQLGYRAGILQSSEAGFPVYRRLGFEKLCEIEVFLWNDSSE
jgi:ribosomal protein S18 acetylase RimI-like enzyme